MSSTQTRRLVLITGATGGIGRATSIELAKTGLYNLALHYSSANQALRDQLLSSIQAAASPAQIAVQFFQSDLSTYDGARELHSSILSTLGQIDILFNNAGGICGHSAVQDLSDVPIEIFEQTWRLNTGSGILLTQLCLPHMRARGWGRVIFNSSLAAFTGGFVGPHYASSKSAMHGFVHWVGNKVAGEGVTVNGVAPAMIADTGMVAGVQEAVERENVEREIAKKLPVGRLGRPEEVAATVLYLINTGFVTRKIITVDGGFHPY